MPNFRDGGQINSLQGLGRGREAGGGVVIKGPHKK